MEACSPSPSAARGFHSAFATDPSSAANPAFWAERLERLEHRRSEQERLDRTLSIAGTLVHAGRRARALDLLEQAANRRMDVLIFAAVHPALRALGDEPRYRRVLQRIGLEGGV